MARFPYKVDEVFVVPDCSKYKKYKVYCIKSHDGKILYIGCTCVILKTRAVGHMCDNTKLRPGTQIYETHKSLGKKITFEILYDFDKKENAAITERILINFYKKHIDNGLTNSKCVLKESNYTLPYKSNKHY